MESSSTTNDNTQKISLAERFKIYNSIDNFMPFQTELMEVMAREKRIAISIGTGIGKTTMMKYLSLDFLDLNVDNRCLILVNTRALAYDIGQSIREIFDSESENKLLCNLCEYDANRPLDKNTINNARLFVGVPDKYWILYNKLPKDFKFICIDEVDALINNDDAYSSTIVRILDSITYTYGFICSATLTNDVYDVIISRYDYISREFNEKIPNIDIKRIKYDKNEKYWHTYVCDKIHHIILENPLMNKVLVFCNFRNDCDRLYNEYKTSGSQPNYCIHGNMNGLKIQELFKLYKSNGKVLFTTDMCQRGLDIKDIDIVFHVGVTGKTEFYHRNGRTLRKSGASPLCFIFTQSHDLIDNPQLANIPERQFETITNIKYKNTTQLSAYMPF